MLRKIDCIMIRVENIEAAVSYFAEVFGLHPWWSGDGSIGLVFQETDAEIVLHCDPNIPSSVEVHYLVDVLAAVADYMFRAAFMVVVYSRLADAGALLTRVQ
jgi:lactoylglutathione lyase